MKTYDVNIDYNASFSYMIKAKSKGEAKRKAWEKHRKDTKVKKSVDFEIEEFRY